MTLLKEYLILWNRCQNEREHILKTFDYSIISSMLKDNISLSEVKKQIRDHSSLCADKSFAEITKYLDSFNYNVKPKTDKVNTLPNYDHYKDKYLKHMIDFYLKKENEIITELTKKGYKTTDIKETVLKNTPFFKDMNISLAGREALTYLAKLDIAYVKEITDIEKAKKEYINQLDTLKAHNKNFRLNLYYDAKIAFLMRYEKNYALPTVKELFLKYTQNKNVKQPEYANTIVNFVREHQHMYNQFLAVNIKQPKNIREKYLKYFNEYLKNTMTKVLSPIGEKQIIKRLLSKGAQKDELIATLKALSPVVQEIGRRKNYAETIVNLAIEDISRAKEHLNKVEDLFKKEIKSLPQKATNLDYALLAKLMIMKGCYPDYIVKTFKENIPTLKDKAAYYVVKSAQNNLKAEKDIAEFICPDKLYEMTLEEIQKRHISLKDVYKYAVKERILTYPNVKLNLSDEYIDIEAAIKLINRYPELDKNELAHVIREASPRMQLPEIAPDYPKLVIEKAVKKLQEVLNIEQTEQQIKDELKQDYNLEVAINKATINNTEEDAQDLQCDWRAALTLIKKGVDENDIKNIIAEEQSLRNQKDTIENFKYGEYITNIAKKIQGRQLNILNILDTGQTRMTNEMTYKQHMKELYLRTNTFNQDMEINTAMYMLYKNIKKEDIAITMTKYSPHIIEPSHASTTYINKSIITEAEKRLEMELEKRKLFAKNTIKEQDVNILYGRYYNAYKDNINLPFDIVADTIIAANMINAGFKVKDVLEAVSMQSPNAIGADYAQKIEADLKNLPSTLENTRTQKQSLVRTITNEGAE